MKTERYPNGNYLVIHESGKRECLTKEAFNKKYGSAIAASKSKAKAKSTFKKEKEE